MKNKECPFERRAPPMKRQPAQRPHRTPYQTCNENQVGKHVRICSKRCVFTSGSLSIKGFQTKFSFPKIQRLILQSQDLGC